MIVKTGVAALIGLGLRLHELQATRVVRCHEDPGGNFEERTEWKHLTVAEKAEINHRLFFPAELHMAGFEIEPESQIVRLDQRVWWSIRSATEGRHDGWIRLGERADFPVAQGSGTTDSRVPLSVDVSEENPARVAVNVIAPPPKTALILSVVGSILGTLLASLPAWLTWFDARRKLALEAKDGDGAQIAQPESRKP